MSTGIYVIQGEGDLLEMEEQAYESEDRLQALLAKHPSIIPGGQIDGANPRRWLLICREAGIPGSEDSGGRWSLDHLLVDQDAIPTLVEVKRSQDTRIRREVVGQMLEYAANVSTYWTLDLLRAQFSATCHERGREAEQVLGEFLDESADAENFWQTVADNLRAGRLRLVFVADVIPTELQAIVEFLNSQMQQVEVIAVEVKRYGTGARACWCPACWARPQRRRRGPRGGSGTRPRSSPIWSGGTGPTRYASPVASWSGQTGECRTYGGGRARKTGA